MLTASELVKKEILSALQSAVDSRSLFGIEVLDAAVERPQNPIHGDFACSLPMKLAKPLNMTPLEIAEVLKKNISCESVIGDTEVAPPGFINIILNRRWLLNQVQHILKNPDTFCEISIGDGSTVQVEYISANPTGRLHIAHARGAVIGSTLAALLKEAGYRVHEEYYLNDAGNQIENFRVSLLTRYKQICGEITELPEGAYPGEDVVDIAKKIYGRDGQKYLRLPEKEALDIIGEIGESLIMEGIEEDVTSLRIKFDNWFSEKSLFRDGQFDHCMDVLTQKGFVLKKDGASWLDSSKLGEEKDNVLIRSTGSPTYFATDIAYHFNKFSERGFDRVINIWGADHQGQVPRLKSALKALDVDPKRLDTVLVQMVRFKKGETSEKLSKRSGNTVPLVDLVKEIGVDACRYMFLSRSHETQLDFDLDLAKDTSSENPVYYVQYAFARICSILELAEERNIEFSDGEVDHLKDPNELNLIKKIIEFPEVIETSVINLEPHHIPHYALELATAFHVFYQTCRVISSDKSQLPLTRARLLLVKTAQTALSKCLSLMSMSAPKKM